MEPKESNVADFSEHLEDAIADREAQKLPVPEEVQEAVRTLLRWAGEDPDREGLIDTPKRVARAWKEYCEGYDVDPAIHLARTFEEVGGFVPIFGASIRQTGVVSDQIAARMFLVLIGDLIQMLRGLFKFLRVHQGDALLQRRVGT